MGSTIALRNLLRRLIACNEDPTRDGDQFFRLANELVARSREVLQAIEDRDAARAGLAALLDGYVAIPVGMTVEGLRADVQAQAEQLLEERLALDAILEATETAGQELSYYGQHVASCSVYRNAPTTDCSCGLHDAEKAVSAAVDAARQVVARRTP